MSDPISKTLDLAPLPDEPQLPTIAKQKPNDNNDYEYARQNIYGVIETGANALDELAQVAAQSQHPRAYEVLTNLVKTLVDANKSLMDLRKAKAELDQKREGTDQPQKVQNNLFVGSTAELQKMLDGMKNGGS